MENKPKIVLLEPVLAHYRKDVFRELTLSHEFNIDIIAGENYNGVLGINNNKYKAFNFFKFNCCKHAFYFLKGVLKYIISNKPDIVISTGVDFHLLHTVLVFFYFRLLLGKPFYWWSHATSGNQGAVGYVIRKFIYKHSSGILAYNQAGKKNLIDMGVFEENIVVVNNSINSEDYGYRNYNVIKKSTNKPFALLFSGRITKAKRINILIKAIKTYIDKYDNDLICYIVGDGAYRKEMDNLVQELKIADCVVFTGARYGKDAHQYFLNADLFVYPGGIGLSILHALSFGLPVLTTNMREAHFPEFELLEEGVDGDLFDHDNPESLAEKIYEWKNKLAQDKCMYAHQCIDSIKKMNYLPESMVKEVLNFLRNKHIG